MSDYCEGRYSASLVRQQYPVSYNSMLTKLYVSLVQLWRYYNANFHRIHACNLFSPCSSAFLSHLVLRHCLCADGLLFGAKICPFDVVPVDFPSETVRNPGHIRDLALVTSVCVPADVDSRARSAAVSSATCRRLIRCRILD